MSNFPTHLQNQPEDTSVDIREFLETYLRKWWLFLLSVVLSLVIAYFYIKYSEQIYQANASILVDENSNSTLTRFDKMDEIFGGKDQVEDEIEIIKSLPNNTKVVKALNLDISYHRKTELSRKLKELYQTTPIKVLKVAEKDSFQGTSFMINVLNSRQFDLIMNEKAKRYNFNTRIPINDYLTIVVQFQPKYINYADKPIYVTIAPEQVATFSLINSLLVEPLSKTSNTVQLSYSSNSKKKSIDILNEVIKQYMLNNVEDKKTLADNTYKFIDDRITFIDKELRDVEQNIQDFKKNNQLTDIVTESKQFSEGSYDTKEKIQEAEIQLDLVNYLMQDVYKNDILLPSNIGLNDPTIAASIQRYNEAVIDKKHYNNSTTELNPETKLATQRVTEARKAIVNSLNNQRGNLQITLKELYAQNANFNAKLRSIPQKEREFKEIFRQQQTKEALFLFLLQKREEAAITKISILPDAKIINHAYGSDTPILPKKRTIYLVAFLLGLVIPIFLIYLSNILDTQFHSETDLEKNTKIPIMGTVARSTTKERMLINVEDRTSIGESFRLLMANVEFSLSDYLHQPKTILFTSTVSGEGKSFISANFASYLSNSGYKVVLVGLDLRAPKLHEFFDQNFTLGITHFIKDSNINVEQIIYPTRGNSNLDLIFSGVVLPNFIEVIKNKRLDEMFSYLKQHYEYIIVDSAPIGLVSDTLNIAPYIDKCIFVVRANFLDKRMLDVVEKVYAEKRFKKLNILLNDVDIELSRYGYGYGYGVKQTLQHFKNKPFTKEFWKYWWEKLF